MWDLIVLISDRRPDIGVVDRKKEEKEIKITVTAINDDAWVSEKTLEKDVKIHTTERRKEITRIGSYFCSLMGARKYG